MSGRIQPIICFGASVQGDIVRDALSFSARGVRVTIGGWFIFDEHETWRDGWKIARKRGYRIIKVKVSKVSESRHGK